MTKTVLALGAAALALAACDGGTVNDTAPVPPAATPGATLVPASTGGANYAEQVVQTPQGGMRMGNPNARVKLVEYVSLTCPVCARFSNDASEALRDRYVASGNVSWEVRHVVANGLDAGAVLLARCGGPGPYFSIVEQLYATQPEWIGRATSQQAQLEALAAAPPAQQFAGYARAAGLDSFVRMRGVPAQRANQCLSDPAAGQRLEDGNQLASREGVTGTPTFFLNGQKADAITWAQLEPLIQARLR